jgi:transcriptional regulator with XRE-family HTH domain
MVEAATSDELSVGDRLRTTREAQGLSLEDIASRTRIPTRHLESIEQGEWSQLPAPTYTVGFAKSYAGALGLDRTEISDALRLEMGGRTRVSTETQVFEPADPARVMPKWLVIAAVLAVLAVVAALLIMRNRSLSGDDQPIAAAPDAPIAGAPPAAPAPVVAPASGPVSIIANEPVWLQVYEKGGAILKAGELRAGERFDVPATAKAPMLKTGKPEALRIAVGTADAPPVGPPATTVKDVSLLGPDLMRGSTTAAPNGAPAPSAATPTL